MAQDNPHDIRWSLRRHLLDADLLQEIKEARDAVYFAGVMPLAKGMPVISVYVEIGPASPSRERAAQATGWIYLPYAPGQEDRVIDALRARRALLAARLKPA